MSVCTYGTESEAMKEAARLVCECELETAYVFKAVAFYKRTVLKEEL